MTTSGDNLPAGTVPSLAERRIPAGENALKIALFLGFLALSFAALDALGDALTALLPGLNAAAATAAVAGFALVLAGAAFVNAMVMLAMAVLAHEAVHRTLFRSRFWNDAWGALLSALALIPFHANRRFHLTHHAYAHQPDRDPENEMHHRRFREALLQGAFHGLKCQYRTWARQLRAGPDSRRQRGRALLDLLSLAIAAFLYFGATTLTGVSPVTTAVPMILAFPLVFSLRALCDHYGVPASMPSAGSRPDIVSPEERWRPAARRVTGWVVLTHPWLEWLWSSVNYHEVHHKFPHLAHCDLKPVFLATRSELPYLTVNGYGRCLRLLSRLPYYPEPDAVAEHLTVSS